MTYEETLGIMGVLKASYPAYYRDMTRKDADGIVGLWAEMFKDEPCEVVALAVKAHIATDAKGFPPAIGAIKDAISKMRCPDEMTEAEAWALVAKAIRNGIYGAKKEFEALPEPVQRIVGSPNQLREWAVMDADSVNSVVASNFQRSYRVRAARNREYAALPSDVREVLGLVSGAMKMPELAAAND